MNKQQIHQTLLDQLEKELASITAAAKSTIDTATDAEHAAKSKYETFGLESSYLARGQAKRVEELSDAVRLIKAMSLKPFDAQSSLMVGALVRLKSTGGDVRTHLIAPGGGGEEVVADDETITVITHISPIGRSLLGKKVGQHIDVNNQQFIITSAE